MTDQPGQTEPAVTPPAAVATPEPPAGGSDDPPAWLPQRLAQARESERKKLLQEFGAENPEALKAKLKKLDELETSKLSEQERIEKLIKELSPKAEQAERLQALLTSVVESKFSALSEQQQQAIDAVAAGNTEERWKLMKVMEAAGFGTPAAPAVPKPASTVPAGATPPPAAATPKTAYEKWADLNKSDSVAASLFYQLNSMAIQQSRKEQ